MRTVKLVPTKSLRSASTTSLVPNKNKIVRYWTPRQQRYGTFSARTCAKI